MPSVALAGRTLFVSTPVASPPSSRHRGFAHAERLRRDWYEEWHMNLEDDVLDQIDEELELDLTDDWLSAALGDPATPAASAEAGAPAQPLHRRDYLARLF